MSAKRRRPPPPAYYRGRRAVKPALVLADKSKTRVGKKKKTRKVKKKETMKTNVRHYNTTNSNDNSDNSDTAMWAVAPAPISFLPTPPLFSRFPAANSSPNIYQPFAGRRLSKSSDEEEKDDSSSRSSSSTFTSPEPPRPVTNVGGMQEEVPVPIAPRIISVPIEEDPPFTKAQPNIPVTNVRYVNGRQHAPISFPDLRSTKPPLHDSLLSTSLAQFLRPESDPKALDEGFGKQIAILAPPARRPSLLSRISSQIAAVFSPSSTKPKESLSRNLQQDREQKIRYLHGLPTDAEELGQSSGSAGAGKKPGGWWRDFSLSSVCCAFCRRRKSMVNEAQPEKEWRLRANDRDHNKAFKHANNFIKTSKYNAVSFLPMNLFEQFQRIANFYFLILMILQFIPWISSIAWYSTAVPLFIVLAFSAIKDAYDDIQRHVSDRGVNGRIAYVVRDGRLVEEKWQDVRVGDVIRMISNQFVAADLLLLSSSEPHGLCYIETKELDGETNLKTRSALPDTAEMGDQLETIFAFNGDIICEAPNNRLDRFQGQLQWQGRTFPLTNDNILLRGCILKNTRWCYGVVIFAGRETKLMMNSGETVLKRTSLDRFLNVLILGIVLFLVAMCLICTILCGVWEWTIGRFFTEYLEWDTSIIPNHGARAQAQVALIAFLMFFSYIILLNTVVPISLYVSVEIIRFLHSLWINYDLQMYYEPDDIPARAHTTTLNEELGQVQYIFSDKTGTLTQNIMTFNKCTINGASFGDVYDERGNLIDVSPYTPRVDFSWNQQYEPTFAFYDRRLLDATRQQNNTEISEFWRLLALCHTVMPERSDKGALVYQAQSPDEAALTAAARNFGYVFRSRTPQSITIDVMGRQEVYELLCILDFDNVRKRMSVIVRDAQGRIRLYCKGADTMVLARLSPTTSTLLRDATNQHLSEFANIGLRTLCLAYKDISQADFEAWSVRHKAAAVDLHDREGMLEAVYEEIERDMTLIGATAIEDKLQDGVPETIAKLAEANIKIWVLTGDKTETAINIAYSCRLLTDDMREIVVVDGASAKEVEVQLKHTRRIFDAINNNNGNQVESHQNGNANSRRPPEVNIAHVHGDGDGEERQQNGRHGPPPPVATLHAGGTGADDLEGEDGGVALVVTGEALVHALDAKLERLFLELACQCKAVICCRVTPLQKAKVVELVKRNKKAVTLSVGDGANDVSMIKTAHIGVGISGQEGQQAVLASDYSIGQFRYLQRLLLVHGRWSYFRMAKFLRYFFYKNFSFTLTNFWYSFFAAYSAMTVFDPVFIACYNLFFTALPVLAMGALDKDLDDEYSLRYGRLYMPGQYNLYFNMRIFIYSVLHGIITSLVIFFVPYGTFNQAIDSNGRALDDYSTLAFTTFTCLIVVVSGQIAFETAYWTWINHFVLWGSLIFYFALAFVFYEGGLALLFTSLYSSLPASWVAKTSSSISYGVAFRVMSTPQFWFALLMVCVVLLLPVILNRFFWLDTHPKFGDRLAARRKLGKHVRPQSPTAKPGAAGITRSAATAGRRSVRSSLRSGYAFSHAPGFGELIVKGKLFRRVDQLRAGGGVTPISANWNRPASPKMLSPVPEDSAAAAGGRQRRRQAPPRPQAQQQQQQQQQQQAPYTRAGLQHSVLISGTADSMREHHRSTVQATPTAITTTFDIADPPPGVVVTTPPRLPVSKPGSRSASGSTTGHQRRAVQRDTLV